MQGSFLIFFKISMGSFAFLPIIYGKVVRPIYNRLRSAPNVLSLEINIRHLPPRLRHGNLFRKEMPFLPRSRIPFAAKMLIGLVKPI